MGFEPPPDIESTQVIENTNRRIGRLRTFHGLLVQKAVQKLFLLLCRFPRSPPFLHCLHDPLPAFGAQLPSLLGSRVTGDGSRGCGGSLQRAKRRDCGYDACPLFLKPGDDVCDVAQGCSWPKWNVVDSSSIIPGFESHSRRKQTSSHSPARYPILFAHRII